MGLMAAQEQLEQEKLMAKRMKIHHMNYRGRIAVLESEKRRLERALTKAERQKEDTDKVREQVALMTENNNDVLEDKKQEEVRGL